MDWVITYDIQRYNFADIRSITTDKRFTCMCVFELGSLKSLQNKYSGFSLKEDDEMCRLYVRYVSQQQQQRKKREKDKKVEGSRAGSVSCDFFCRLAASAVKNIIQ